LFVFNLIQSLIKWEWNLGCVSQWQSACLTWAWSWVLSLKLQRKRKGIVHS
jgi:hypothetical protein